MLKFRLVRARQILSSSQRRACLARWDELKNRLEPRARASARHISMWNQSYQIKFNGIGGSLQYYLYLKVGYCALQHSLIQLNLTLVNYMGWADLLLTCK